MERNHGRRRLAQRGNRYGDLGQPRHVALGPDGVLFIADGEFGCVHLFTQGGDLLMLVGGTQLEGGRMSLPCSLTATDMSPEGAFSKLVPPDFVPQYFVFVSNRIGTHRLGLFAVGEPQPTAR